MLVLINTNVCNELLPVFGSVLRRIYWHWLTQHIVRRVGGLQTIGNRFRPRKLEKDRNPIFFPGSRVTAGPCQLMFAHRHYSYLTHSFISAYTHSVCNTKTPPLLFRILLHPRKHLTRSQLLYRSMNCWSDDQTLSFSKWKSDSPVVSTNTFIFLILLTVSQSASYQADVRHQWDICWGEVDLTQQQKANFFVRTVNS